VDPWRPDDLGEDELKMLAWMVVDFNRTRGLRDADDDDLLAVVIAAYLAGRKSLSEVQSELGKAVLQ
jgi:hypothetical protein